jgi:hypothetical protein
MGKRTAILRGTSVAGYVAGALALGAVMIAGTVAAPAAETLSLTTVVSVTGGKINSFDISFVDPAIGLYVLGDRTNKGVTVINTTTSPPSYGGTFQAGFQGVVLNPNGTANNNLSGPNGVMIVNHREVWAGDGDSTVKILNIFTGGLVQTVSTGGMFRADEMCFDPVHNIGFVANNADNPPFITAISGQRGHPVLGKSVFSTAGNGINATDGIEQCGYNPRDGKIYVAVPELNGPGDNSQPGGVARINPQTLAVEAVATIPLASCSGPQGLAIGPVVNGHGQILLGCNGAIGGANAADAPLTRTTAVIDDGFPPGNSVATVIYSLNYEAGNDEVWYNGCVYPTTHPNYNDFCPNGAQGDKHYYLARGGNNTFNNYNPNQNPTPNGSVSPQFLTCPGTHNPNDFINYNNYTNYGGNIYVSQNTLGQSSLNGTIFQPYAGPQVLGMVNALTGIPNADTITGLANCSATNPGPKSTLSPPPPSAGYTLCAPENGTCSFTGTQNVAFGANGQFYYKTNVTGPIACNDATFGDPIFGTVKACYYGPGTPGTVSSGASNAHGSGHSVAADLVHNYIFVPIPNNNFVSGMTGICSSKGGSDTNGCIAVYSTVGKD